MIVDSLEGRFPVAPRRDERLDPTPGNRHGRNDTVILGDGDPLTDIT
jgi:hypothetical protein